MSLGLFFTCARCACPCAPADTWSTVDFFVRRPCAACLACPRACSLRSPPVRGCACSRCSRHFIRLYCRFSRRASARWACRKLFLRSFSSRRYLFSCRPRGWVARLDIAIWADLAVLRCFDDLLTSHDIKKIFCKGVDSVRPSCYAVHVNRKDTHDRRIQARQARPTSNSKASRTDRRANASHRPDARKQVSEQRTAEASPPNLYKCIGGRHMAGRPKDGGQPLTSLSIRISTEMKAELEARARRQRRTTSDYVKLLLEKVLSEPEPERE